MAGQASTGRVPLKEINTQKSGSGNPFPQYTRKGGNPTNAGKVSMGKGKSK